MTLSSLNIVDLQTEIIPLDYSYFQKNRLYTETSAISTLMGLDITQYDSLKNAKDVSFNNDTLVVLTDKTTSFLSNKYALSGTPGTPGMIFTPAVATATFSYAIAPCGITTTVNGTPHTFYAHGAGNQNLGSDYTWIGYSLSVSPNVVANGFKNALNSYYSGVITIVQSLGTLTLTTVASGIYTSIEVSPYLQPVVSAVSGIGSQSPSINLGINNESSFVNYHFCLGNSNNNNVNVASSYAVANNNLLLSPYKTDTKYNIIPLKSNSGINGEYKLNARDYDAVYYGNNQRDGLDNIFLQYKSELKPVKLYNDVFNKCYLPDNIAEIDISNSSFIIDGAWGGNEPLNSDCILAEQWGYENFTNKGPTNNINVGVPLCVWLSANSPACSASAVWMERWYDPNNITQGDAFIASTNPLSSYNPVYDKVSNLTLLPKSSFSYLRYGTVRNETYVNSFSSNLILHMDEWSNKIKDKINDISGFAIGQYSSDTWDIADMTGKFHFHIPPADELFFPNNLTAAIWVHQNKWTCGIDTQYIGDFSNNEGWGLFFNTAANSELITLPTTEGFIYGFNYNGIKVFEKSINASTNVLSSRIDYITTDLFGSRWTYDSLNNKIYKLDTDDLLKEVIVLPTSANIVKMQINSQNELYVMNTFSSVMTAYNLNWWDDWTDYYFDYDLWETVYFRIYNVVPDVSGFDIAGNLIYNASLSGNYNNFEIDKNDTLQFNRSDIFVIDNDNNEVYALGINLYKNGVLFYHVGKRIKALNVDSFNNYWILYGDNMVLKLDSTGKVLFNKHLDLPFDVDPSMELNFVKEIKGSCDYDVTWIVCNTQKYVVKLDSAGTILKIIYVPDVVNLRKCGNFDLNVRGDFTGFENKRKFYNLPDGAIISSNNPTITAKINLRCGDNKKIIQIHSPASGLTEWNHLAFTYELDGTSTILKLYINGIEMASKTIPGLYFIDYGTKVSPFIVGGHSGKLGAKNVERSMNGQGFFQGRLDDLRLYNSALNTFQLRGLAMNKFWDNWEPLTWFMPIPQRTFMEEIISYHLNKYKGQKSNKYSIKIKNLRIDDVAVRDTITNSIINSIRKISPLHTMLYKVVFENRAEDSTTVDVDTSVYLIGEDGYYLITEWGDYIILE